MTTKLYLAPMEENTGYIYRNLQHEMFGFVDKYFAPFITTNSAIKLKPREKKDINPNNNSGINLVPQILTDDAEMFIEYAKKMFEIGYGEVNLNLGCPSNTVAKKGRGSGFLLFPDKLDSFFDTVMNKLSDALIKISVKTRIGYNDLSEFDTLIEIFNKYNLTELIIHPRLKTEMYEGLPHIDVFDRAYNIRNDNLCYNGDIFNVSDYYSFIDKYPQVNAVMIGRGAIANPAIFREIKDGAKLTNSELLDFHNELFARYKEVLGAKDAMFKMKEIWVNMGKMFDEERKVRRIIRSKTVSEFLMLSQELISNGKIL